jgi:PAS fold.
MSLPGEGQVATLEWSYHAFFSAEGEPQEYQLGGRDVSSLRKIGAGEKIPAAYIPATESVVKNAELSELVATLQSLEAPVFAVDENGVILAWSKKLVELTGIAAADMVGKGGQEYGVPFYGKCAPMLVDNVLPSSSGTKNEGRPVAKREGETLIGEMEQSR